MDYARVYREFIADRKRREGALVGYTERHHILPRRLGGGDEPSNLIRLTPEDHYFAHLLLAKIHGGNMWAAVHAMCHLANKGTRRHRSRLHARMQFGHVRRGLAEYYRSVLSGPDGKIADPRAHRLKHFDGREAIGNRFELSRATGVTRHQISAVLRGAKKSAHGWYCPKHNPHGLTRGQLISKSKRSPERHTLYHFDGRIWTGTRGEFRDMTGLPLLWKSPAHRSIAGWYRVAEDAARHTELVAERARRASASRGDISGARNPMAGADRRKDMIVNLVHKDGRRFAGSLKRLADEHGFSAAQFGTFKKVLKGTRVVGGFAVKSFHGWQRADV